MYGIFYKNHMVGITIYKTKEWSNMVLRTQYGNNLDYSVVELEVIG